MFQPRLRIDLDALVANWRMYGRLSGGRLPAAVLKADAYGLGAARVGPALAKAGCRRFYVAWPQEGAVLREVVGPAVEIAVFHGVSSDSLDLFRTHRLEPVLNSMPQLDLWLSSDLAAAPASLHLDTGMNRLGLPPAEWGTAARKLRSPQRLLSHLACADAGDHLLNKQQLDEFMRCGALWPEGVRSLSASAGAYLGHGFTMEEIRPGIGIYGGGPPPPAPESLHVVATMTAPVLQVRNVRKGEGVGYGEAWVATSDVSVATVGLGYADGFLRSASNRGAGFVRGVKRPILGRVSMDLIMIDVTGLDVSFGDEVQFLGRDMPLSDVAESMGTIDYELLTRLGPRFKRHYVASA